MKQDTTHMRVYRRTLQNLRRIHAETGDRLVDILDELVAKRLEALRNPPDEDARRSRNE